MLIQSETPLEAICVLILFIPLALGLVIISGAIAGIYLLIVFIINKIRGKKDEPEEVIELEEVEDLRSNP